MTERMKHFSINALLFKRMQEMMDTGTGNYFGEDMIRHYAQQQAGPDAVMENGAFRNIWYGGREHEYFSSDRIYNFWIRRKKHPFPIFGGVTSHSQRETGPACG